MNNLARRFIFRSLHKTCRAYATTQTAPKTDVAKENEGKKTTHFGFQTVDAEKKEEKVYEVFESVAEKYDLMNDVMSLGIHRVWKDIFIDRLGPTKDTKLLDMAGGTGDIAFRFLNYAKNANVIDSCHVTVCDINQAMLDVGKKRGESQGWLPQNISWKQCNAEQLDFPDDTFTAYTVAYGIRNMTNIDKVLKEAYRVLKPGGRFLCLEFSQLEHESAQWIYDQYSFKIIPVLGQLIQGSWKPYQYLVESIKQFPNQELFKSMIEEAGFRQVTYENLTLGITAIHSGFKI